MDIRQIRMLLFAGVILSIIVVILLIVLVINAQRYTAPSGQVNETFVPQSTITALPPTPTEIPWQFTGDNNEDTLSLEEKSEINMSFELMRKLPINDPNFYLDFDYSNMKFIVTLINPETFNQDQFRLWLNQNGYSAISQNSFIFQ